MNTNVQILAKINVNASVINIYNEALKKNCMVPDKKLTVMGKTLTKKDVNLNGFTLYVHYVSIHTTVNFLQKVGPLQGC